MVINTSHIWGLVKTHALERWNTQFIISFVTQLHVPLHVYLGSLDGLFQEIKLQIK